MAKSLFEKGVPPRVLTTVTAMLRSGDITQEEADAGERWYRDYQLAYLTGYTLSRLGQDNTYEAPPEGHDPNTLRLKHDAVSFSVVRAEAAVRISEIRCRLGMCGHQRLKMMLVDEMSFSDMGAIIFPRAARTNAITSIKSQCSMVLLQLAESYREKAKSSREKIGLSVYTECA
ncbi:hypothetical protein [Acetobacter sp.]|uniref:hypothetical protein n=1 Tax=Acetobacter sp. TaxID=440 RepID=UPI0039EA6C3E